MEILEGIYTRRSVRNYTDQPVDRSVLLEIIEAGSWAPSGLNNQPWRFVIVVDMGMKSKLAGFTKYSRIVESAPSAIAVFIDHEAMYNDVKDHQSMGACLQNMLLAAHAMGLGAVWLGEILKNAGKVRELFGLAERFELMAVVAVGHPEKGDRSSKRRKIEELLLKEF
ncbi:MAG TPA: nitroreductase [Geobacteraceae bacterium]|nr:nitroreductase [Geobacteraceae bacterium]